MCDNIISLRSGLDQRRGGRCSRQLRETYIVISLGISKSMRLSKRIAVVVRAVRVCIP